MASAAAGVASAMANLAMQPGNVVAVSARALVHTAMPVWRARASHAFKRWAVVRFTGMFRL
ncbi:MAG: hypothetical protein CBARDMAM_5419 [uncultured Caballeronia sp.]|nr:MAG: hypothetical protein CBARDMAM_5419 [uncultured Caballeronia sp.]